MKKKINLEEIMQSAVLPTDPLLRGAVLDERAKTDGVQVSAPIDIRATCTTKVDVLEAFLDKYLEIGQTMDVSMTAIANALGMVTTNVYRALARSNRYRLVKNHGSRATRLHRLG